METWINPKTGKGWSDREEQVIAEILVKFIIDGDGKEYCTRVRAIQYMRRNKLDDLRGVIRK